MEVVEDKLIGHYVDCAFNHLEVWKSGNVMSDLYFLRIFNQGKFTEFILEKDDFKDLLKKI